MKHLLSLKSWQRSFYAPPDGPASTLRTQKLPRAKSRAIGHRFYYRWPVLLNCLRLADLLGLLVSGFIAFMFRFGTFLPEQNAQLYLYFSSVATVVSLQLSHAYTRRNAASLDRQLAVLFKAGVAALLISLLCGFISRSLGDYSRGWVILTVVVGAVLLCFNRMLLSRFIQHGAALGHLSEHIVLVGATERAGKLIAALHAESKSGVRVLGVFEDRLNRPLPDLHGLAVLGTTDDLIEFSRVNRVDRVVVTMPWISSSRIDQMLQKLSTVPARLDLVPHDMIWRYRSVDMQLLAGIPVATITNGLIDDQSGIAKRAFDLCVAALMLTCLAPVMLAVALAIKIDSKGPVLFRQKRHGFNNTVFDVYKFRSMTVAGSIPDTVVQATRNDARITRLGRFLRRSSLDELPQLFNVLRGEMSIVGPRPHAVEHNLQYARTIIEYYGRHNVKPGITGWAQVNGLRGETDTEEKMRQRVALDLYYIERWSLLFDAKIVLLTAATVWFQSTAY